MTDSKSHKAPRELSPAEKMLELMMIISELESRLDSLQAQLYIAMSALRPYVGYEDMTFAEDALMDIAKLQRQK